MHNPGHELGRVQPEEIVASTVDAIVYREYFDPHYTQPNTSKLIEADVNEPSWDRRVPGCVLYARPGERLYIHVLNGDPQECHSLHLHGLRYASDSDGAWPFGVATRSGKRSDEIRTGESWTYVFDATEETIGVWPFHDHVRNVQRNINRGLFGALIVRDPAAPRADHEIPLFVHQVQGASTTLSFESQTMGHGATFPYTFPDVGAYPYHCKIHGASMAGTIIVDPNAPAGDQTVVIGDNFFNPATRSVRPGSKVIWRNDGAFDHIVFAPGGGAATFSLNGRAYVGNTPTIEVEPGQRLRWYLCNLDIGSVWHNVHPHAVRWRLPIPTGGATDVHALSPAQTFTMDTEAPAALRLPCALERLQCDPPDSACRARIKGDYLFHCHIEEHMMAGLAGLVRSTDWIWITKEALAEIDLSLPYYDQRIDIDWVDLKRCGQKCPTGKHNQHSPRDDASTSETHVHVSTAPSTASMMMMPGMPKPQDICVADKEGVWELLPVDSKVLAVHAVLMHSGRVLFFAGSGNNVPRFNAHDVRSVVWDYQAGTFHTPVTPFDVFCAGQTVLPDGKVLVAGGTQQYDPFIGLHSSWLFDPALEEWIRIGDMTWGRWYPTLVSLGDSRAIAVSGINQASEVYSPSSLWSVLPKGTDLPLFPHVFQAEDGKVFFTGGQFGNAVLDARKIDLSTAAETIIPGLRAQGNRDQSFSVLLPPAQDQRFMVLGGNGPVHATNLCDIVNLKKSAPKYVAAADMQHARGLHNCVILPDRKILVSGGGYKAESRADAVHQAEIYDPETNTFHPAGTQIVARLYHSIALLLPDGRVITGGSNPDRGDDELRLELYHPPYLFRGPRPIIQSAPDAWSYGQEVAIHTPNSLDIKWAHLIRPMACTHSCDTSQRLVDLPILNRDVCHLHVRVTNEPNIAPPGWYLLFLCDNKGVPSTAEWVHLDKAPAIRPMSLNVKVLRSHLSHMQQHRVGFPIPGAMSVD